MGEILLSGQPGSGKTLLLLKIIRESEFENVVWVTTTRSAKALRKILKRDDIWIVDTHTWAPIKGHQRDVVIGNPLNLNEVNLGISKLLDLLGRDILIIFDSLTGLLLYHDLQKLVYFLRGVLVKMEERRASSIFTFVKGAHSTEVEFSLYTFFPNIVELLNTENDRKKIIRVVKATEWVDPNYGEVEIVKDDILIPKNIMDFILRVLKE